MMIKTWHTAVAALCILYTGIAQAGHEEVALAEQSIVKQMDLLNKIQPLLLEVTDFESANRHAAKLAQLCKEYEQEKRMGDIAEDKLTDKEEDALERKYDRILERLEDRVEDLAEKIYEDKECYGSVGLMQAIRSIAD